MRKQEKKPAATHAFTLILPDISEVTEDLENALFKAGCADALLASRGGVVYLDFDREAASFREAVLSALQDVRKAGVLAVRKTPGPRKL